MLTSRRLSLALVLITGILMPRVSSAMPIFLTPISITPPRLPGQQNTPTETPEENGTPTDFTPGTPTFTPTPTEELTRAGGNPDRKRIAGFHRHLDARRGHPPD